MLFRHLLILAIYRLAEFTINSVFDFAIGIITCFLDSFLVIMLILGFFYLLLLFLALIIFPTSLANKDGKASLICKISSMFGKILALEACAYNFLTLEKIRAFLVMVSTFLLRGGGTKTVRVEGTALGGRVGVGSD